jgi:hypothetical protein
MDLSFHYLLLFMYFRNETEYGVDHKFGPVPGYVVPTSFGKDRHAAW